VVFVPVFILLLFPAKTITYHFNHKSTNYIKTDQYGRIFMRLSVLILVVLFVSLSLVGCGGKSKSTEPEKGSLMRSFKLIDDQGRESGTLVLNPQGGAELRDTDGKVIGSFAPKQEANKTVEETTTADKEEAGTSDKEKDEDVKE
jgi:hypothetical protein